MRTLEYVVGSMLTIMVLALLVGGKNTSSVISSLANGTGNIVKALYGNAM